MKAWVRLVVAAGAILLALAVPAGASARSAAHQRHVQVIQPRAEGSVTLGVHGGYRVSVFFEEPDLATLNVVRVDAARLGVEETKYGAHFHGSLLHGRVTADFGPVGSLVIRFRPGGPVKEGHLPKECEGRPYRVESGRWVGSLSLRGEGGYFAVSAASAAGELDRTFRLRCRVRRPLPLPARESLRGQVEPRVGASIVSVILGTASSLEVTNEDGGRRVAMRAAHAIGRGPGAEVEASAFEYLGQMPVGRFVQILSTPPGSLVTTLPGEHPATATLKPGAPFIGEAAYRADSATDHSWAGTLAVRFPGLVQPLVGPGFYSSLCVVSPLVKPGGCTFKSPDLQGGEEPATSGARR